MKYLIATVLTLAAVGLIRSGKTTIRFSAAPLPKEQNGSFVMQTHGPHTDIPEYSGGRRPSLAPGPLAAGPVQPW